MTLYDYIILAAEQSAVAASAPRPALPPVDPAAVEAVISGISAAATQEKRRDPDATTFCLSAWSSSDRAAVALGNAVAEQLGKLGFTVHLESDTPSPGQTAPGIFLSYEDLATVAGLEVERRNTWLDEARSIWRKVAGPDATVETMPSTEGPVVQFTTTAIVSPAGPQRPARLGTRPSPKTWQSDTSWNARPVAEVVAMAHDILRPLLWNLDDVEKLWKEKTEGTVSTSFGLWSDAHGGGSNPVDTLVFGVPGCEPPEHTVAQTDHYAVTSVELVDKMAVMFGLAVEQPETKTGPTHGGAANGSGGAAQGQQSRQGGQQRGGGRGHGQHGASGNGQTAAR